MQRGISIISLILLGAVGIILAVVLIKISFNYLNLSALEPIIAALPIDPKYKSWQNFSDQNNFVNFKLPEKSVVANKTEGKGEQVLQVNNPAFDLTLKVKTASISSPLKTGQTNKVIGGINWIVSNFKQNGAQFVEYSTTKDNKDIIFTFRVPNPTTNIPENILSTFKFKK